MHAYIYCSVLTPPMHISLRKVYSFRKDQPNIVDRYWDVASICMCPRKNEVVKLGNFIYIYIFIHQIIMIVKHIKKYKRENTISDRPIRTIQVDTLKNLHKVRNVQMFYHM